MKLVSILFFCFLIKITYTTPLLPIKVIPNHRHESSFHNFIKTNKRAKIPSTHSLQQPKPIQIKFVESLEEEDTLVDLLDEYRLKYADQLVDYHGALNQFLLFKQKLKKSHAFSAGLNEKLFIMAEQCLREVYKVSFFLHLFIYNILYIYYIYHK